MFLPLHHLKELVFLVLRNTNCFVVVHDNVSTILVDILFDVLQVN